MPWSTPTLRDVRSGVRDAITGRLPGADANVPNSVLRVLSDAMGALCHMALQYIDWLALQLLPDTAETEWLDRQGHIWLTNSDGSTGRKLATQASGTVEFVTSTGSVTVPTGTQLSYGGTGVLYQTTADILTDATGLPTPAPIVALDPGSAGNLDSGTALGVLTPLTGTVDSVTVDTLDGGTDDETDDELRARVLRRIRQPPMGGDATDYEAWALAVPGVTRAWCAPMEMGVGTVSVRFMMDDLRADNGGFPLQTDIDAVSAYLDTVRPVTVKECYVLAPLKQPIDFDIANLNPDTTATRAAIEQSILDMLFLYAAPGQTIYAAWKYAAVMSAAGVISFDMTTTEDDVMPDNGHMATLGDIYYSTTPVPPPVSQQSIAYSSHG
jgi:uncharacterized phage protein gp47/JayE